jgi:hypothetical protein
VNDALENVCIHGTPTEYDCPNCHYDHTTESSSGVYDDTFVSPTTINGRVVSPVSFSRGRCPVCKGVGTIQFENKTYVASYITWNPTGNGAMEELPIGTEGNNIVLLRVPDTKHYAAIRDCVYATIDGVRCELYFPPIIRKAGRENVFVLAYFSSSEAGHDTGG